jgi:hypothetical protein
VVHHYHSGPPLPPWLHHQNDLQVDHHHHDHHHSKGIKTRFSSEISLLHCFVACFFAQVLRAAWQSLLLKKCFSHLLYPSVSGLNIWDPDEVFRHANISTCQFTKCRARYASLSHGWTSFLNLHQLNLFYADIKSAGTVQLATLPLENNVKALTVPSAIIGGVLASSDC